MPNIALRGAKLAEKRGIIISDSLYPVHYDISNKIKPELNLAIIRQESGFDSQAVSAAGAYGLMQLMPTTAKDTAKKNHIQYKQTDLINPQYNMLLGSSHMKEMIDYYQDSLVLAIASYNAGAHNINRWIKELGDIRTLQTIDERVQWIELIPFAETRDYVQQVIAGMQTYRHLLGSRNSNINSLAQDLLS